MKSLLIAVASVALLAGTARAEDAPPAAASPTAPATAPPPASANTPPAGTPAAGATPAVTTATPPAAAQPKTIEEILDALAKAIREKNNPMRMRLWFRVREQGKSATKALIAGYSKYPEIEVKEYMIKCLSWTTDPEAFEFVKGKMKDTDVVIRRRATYEINNFDDHKATPLLCDALGDPDERVRVHACQALGVLDDKAAIPCLKQTYASDKSDLVKQFAKKQLELYEINYPEAKVE